MKEVTVLKVDYVVNDESGSIYPTVLTCGEEMILVDCGYLGYYDRIKESAIKKGVDLDRLTHIIITHHDYDHVGGLGAFLSAYPKVKVLTSVEQAPYISGEKKSLRVAQAEQIHSILPEEKKAFAQKLIHLFSNVETAAVDFLLADGDVVPYCGGIEVVMTNGHMPGHISLYLKASKTLIAGDALCIENGKLAICNPQFTMDLKEAYASVRKLKTYDIEKIICYHGGYLDSDIPDLMDELLRQEQ